MADTNSLPEKTGYSLGLSSSVLKIIAITTMLIDHTAVVMISPDPSVLRNIGRIAFPLFAFMIAEGARHTRDIKKYALRLLLFAFISEIPFDMAFGSGFLDFSKQNVYFTLLAGLVSVYLIRLFKEKKLTYLGIFTTLIIASAAMLMSTDYGFTGVIVITLFYVISDYPKSVKYIGYILITLLTVVVILPRFPYIAIAPTQIFAVISAVILIFYNGQKGFKINRYFFYAFYPGHIIILALIRLIVSYFN